MLRSLVVVFAVSFATPPGFAQQTYDSSLFGIGGSTTDDSDTKDTSNDLSRYGVKSTVPQESVTKPPKTVFAKEPAPVLDNNTQPAAPLPEPTTSKSTTLATSTVPQTPEPVGQASVPLDSPLVSGLTLGSGPLIKGVGSGAEVLAVRPGSPADIAGITPGMMVLWVDGGASTPEGLLIKVVRAFRRQDSVNIMVELPDRDKTRKEFTLFKPADPNRGAMTSTLTVNSLVAPIVATGKFSEDISHLAQLLALAEAVGVPEREISLAMSQGRLNPHLSDLFPAYLELDGPSCKDLTAASVASLREKGNTQLADYMEQDLRSRRDHHCQTMHFFRDKERIETWNARFGPLPDFVRARPIDRTVVSFYLGSDPAMAAYAQNRCDFTYALSQLPEGAQALVECDGLVPSNTRNLGVDQLSAARRTDNLGSADGRFSYRLRLMADGAFEGLKVLAREDQNDGYYRALLSEPRDPADDTPNWTRLISLYAVARPLYLGDCGERLTQFSQDAKYWTEYRNFYGHYRGTSEVRETTTRLDIVSTLSAALDRSERLASMTPTSYTAIAEVFERLTCGDPLRVQLEQNMAAYLRGLPPIHVRAN